MYVIIGLDPGIDTSVVVGSFRTYRKALAASEKMNKVGFNTEICEIWTLASVIEQAEQWEREDNA